MADEVVNNTKKISKNDTTFYRLIVLFVYAVVSLIGINIILKYEVACRTVFTTWYFKAIALAIFALCVFVIIKRYGENNIIRFNAIAKVAAPVFFMLAVYTNLNMGNLKTEIVIIATVLLSFVDIVYPKAFYYVSLFMVVEFITIYYVNHSSSSLLDEIVRYISYPLSIVLPVCIIVLSILLLKGKTLNKFKTLFVQKKNRKLFNNILLILGVFTLICAVVVMVWPVVYVVMPYVLIGAYILMGVIGTVKII